MPLFILPARTERAKQIKYECKYVRGHSMEGLEASHVLRFAQFSADQHGAPMFVLEAANDRSKCLFIVCGEWNLRTKDYENYRLMAVVTAKRR